MVDHPNPPQEPSPAPHTGPDRRRDRRRLVQTKALLTVLDGPHASTTHEITTRNLSMGGICFLLREALSVGQTCQVELQEETGPARSYFCEIVRSRRLSNGKHEMAAQFRKPAGA